MSIPAHALRVSGLPGRTRTPGLLRVADHLRPALLCGRAGSAESLTNKAHPCALTNGCGGSALSSAARQEAGGWDDRRDRGRF